MRSTFSASARTRRRLGWPGRSHRPRRRLAGATAFCGLLLITAAAAGCSGSSASSSAATSGGVAGPESAPSAAAASAAAASASAPAASSAQNGFAGSGGSSRSSSSTTDKLVATGQQLIYTAQLTVRAKDVQAAVNRATSVVSAAGGYVSTENIVAAPPGHPNEASASVTLKIPAAAYAATLAALSGTSLGTQLSLTQQTQDVTQQVADVDSRVASDEAAIAQLRALLKHAGSVSSLLEVQNQINSEESDLESMLAQQNALNHETAYATVTLSLVGPKVPVKHHAVAAKPPPGLTGGLSGGWHAFRLTISWLLTVIGAVAPFLGVIVVLGGLGWWSRRRLNQRRQPPPASPEAPGTA
ncbi:MAG TPA: DUF4349 domain-containing protein [Trebonia sp.]|nr:DUF4349 domain-containing protein [Trebonia sp.]